MTHAQTEQDRQEASRRSLAASIDRWTNEGDEATATAIPGLLLYKQTVPSQPIRCIYESGVALVAQGSKRVLLGNETLYYNAGDFLITSVDLPATAQILTASQEAPHLALCLLFEPRLLAEMVVEGNLSPPRAISTARGMEAGRASLTLLCAFERLLDLLDEPEAIPVLAPMIQREIAYRLLTSEHSGHLWQIAATGSQSQRIGRAIDWLKTHFAEPLRIDELASSVQMSPSTFHLHFKALTAMSPLQYQKWLRLHEARRLMLSGRLDAASTAFQVGYESASQFGREYHRLFGAPPLRDVARLRQASGA
ncbi:AraC family transcriptional regulator [Paludibacterium sp.]|uniref:AraC family transcriptional regulator n=3 Tax=Paludibacterium sp. TaxID=1917523 RepID=UPI0025E27723|nr:AraC family transcriptional regulator [Paludibacterium sp.]